MTFHEDIAPNATKPISFKIKYYILPAIAIFFLSILIGDFVGQTRNHAVVLAALIPAVLSLAGAAIWITTHPNDASNNITAALLLILTSGIFIGTTIGINVVERQNNKLLVQHLNQQRHFQNNHENWLSNCAEIEFRINYYRTETLGLPPLPHQAICNYSITYNPLTPLPPPNHNILSDPMPHDEHYP